MYAHSTASAATLVTSPFESTGRVSSTHSHTSSSSMASRNLARENPAAGLAALQTMYGLGGAPSFTKPLSGGPASDETVYRVAKNAGQHAAAMTSSGSYAARRDQFAASDETLASSASSGKSTDDLHNEKYAAQRVSTQDFIRTFGMGGAMRFDGAPLNTDASQHKVKKSSSKKQKDNSFGHLQARYGYPGGFGYTVPSFDDEISEKPALSKVTAKLFGRKT